MDRGRVLRYAVMAAIIAAYIAARLWRLTDSCLWFDEIFSVHAAEYSWDSILSFIALDLIHPPLFYVLLKLWMELGGDSLFWLRLLPVIISWVALIPFLLVCSELKVKPWMTALALLLLAVNGALIKYAQEVRMYSLLLCLALFSMWLFARYVNGKKGYVALIVTNILLVHTHYFGWFLVASEIAAILVLQRSRWRQIAVMFGIVLASFLPWMVMIWRATTSGSDLGQNIGWMTRPSLPEFRVFVFDLIEPFYYQGSSVEPSSLYRVSVPILLITVTTIVLYFVRWKPQTRDEKRTVYFLLIFTGLPMIAAFVASWLLPYSIWGTRHLIIVFAPVAIVVANAVAAIHMNSIRISLVTLLLLFTGYGLVVQASRPFSVPAWCGFEVLGEEIASNGQGPIYVFEDLAAYHMWFAIREKDDQKQHGRVVKVTDAPGMSEDRAFFLPRGFNEVRSVRLEELTGESLWFAFRTSKDGETAPFIDNFRRIGYRACPKSEVKFDSTAVLFVELTRRTDSCH